MTNNTTADTTAKDEQWVLLVKGQEILPGDQMLCDDAEMWVTLASPEGEIFDPSKYLPVRRKRSAIAREGVVVRYKHGKWNGLMTPDPAGYFVRAEDYDTLRAQLEAAEAEIRAVWQSMPVGRLYLDPPDGGDVPLHEQVRRMGEEVIAQESRGDLAIADLSRLRAVVKAFYNQTIADTTVRISCKSSAVRDRVDALVRELRPLLEDTRKEQPAARTKEAAP